MEGLGVLVIIILVALLLYSFSFLFRSGAPSSVVKDGYDNFCRLIPKDFTYKYYNDYTGYAINIEKKQIFLYDTEYKTYDFSSVRNIERRWNTPGKHTLIGKSSVGDQLQVSRLNYGEEKNAYDSSGLFVYVADIKIPMWRIKFVSESSLLKSYEIVLQAIEGVLPNESDETSSNAQHVNLTKVMEYRKATGVCISCGSGLYSAQEQEEGYCNACRDK